MDAQSRIINHMNKDHGISLEDYLEVYGNQKITPSITEIKMVKFDLDSIQLTYLESSEQKFVEIPIEPPLATFDDARVRLVEMAKAAAEKRGFSAFQINDLIYPSTFFETLNFTLFSAVAFGSRFPEPIYFLFEAILQISHETTTTILSYFPATLRILLIIHSIEFLFVLRPFLDRYRVSGSLRLQYFFMCLFEGIFLIKRMKRKAQELEHPAKQK